MNSIKMAREQFLGLTLSSAIILFTLLAMDSAYAHVTSTSMLTTTISNSSNNTTQQQHAAHIFDNLTISEHIPLTGQLVSGDYILLMDLTPFSTSIEGHSHIALKIPCNEDGSPKATMVTGVAPNFKSLDIDNAINNGTLDGKNLDLSAEGKSCLYHTELPNGTTDIALVNTSNQTLNFNEGGYPSVTVSAHGMAIQHIPAPMMTNLTSAAP
jgi:hypothetical protein